MKALILAAGFGLRLRDSARNTRHEELIFSVPKGLVPIKGKPVVHYIVDELKKSGIDDISLITNNYFFNQFKEKLIGYDVKIYNDGVNCKGESKGSIGDIQHFIETSSMNDDLLIVGGDNLFSFDMDKFVEFFRVNRNDAIVIRNLEDKSLASNKYGVVELDGNLITSFEEKPKEPRTNFATSCIYIFNKDTLPLFKKYIEKNNDPDTTGYFISWLLKEKLVNGWVTDAKNIIDIGSLSQIEDLIE